MNIREDKIINFSRPGSNRLVISTIPSKIEIKEGNYDTLNYNNVNTNSSDDIHRISTHHKGYKNEWAAMLKLIDEEELERVKIYFST